MEPILKFNVRNQNISRVDSFYVVAKSQNYLKAQFSFLTDDWYGVQKTAIFDTGKTAYEVLLTEDSCTIPWEWLIDPGVKYVSVFGGNLITVNKANVTVHESGYKESETPEEPTPDIYSQLMTLIGSKADGLEYKNSILRLLSGETELARVTIAGGSGGGADGREIELQNDGTYIQWRYVGELAWTNLVSLEDITGPAGKDGADGKDGLDGPPGSDGYSPSAKVTQTDTGAVISITDQAGTTTATVVNGRDGEKGDKGDPGDVGPQGPAGPAGADGKDGATPNLQIGTVETLAAGSNATANISGTTEKPLLNLGIPKGADGEGGAAADMQLIFTEAVTTDETGVTNITRTFDDNGNQFELSELILTGSINTINNEASPFTFAARDTTTEGAKTYNYQTLFTALNLSLQSSATYSAKIRCHAKKIIGNLWTVEYAYMNKGVGYVGCLEYSMPQFWPPSIYYTFTADAIRQIKIFGTFANGSNIKVYGR